MSIQLIGYSERGMINAIADDLSHAKDPCAVTEKFLSLLTFPLRKPAPSFTGIKEVLLLVEQSFSSFGDPDLTILLKFNDDRKHLLFLEAKVHTNVQVGETINARWSVFQEFLRGENKASSSLFAQLYRKDQLINHLRDSKAKILPDGVSRNWNIGSNSVVLRARDLCQAYAADSASVVMLLPEPADTIVQLFNATLNSDKTDPHALPAWNAKDWGFMTWAQVETLVNANTTTFPTTIANFKHNREQIYCN